MRTTLISTVDLAKQWIDHGAHTAMFVRLDMSHRIVSIQYGREDIRVLTDRETFVIPLCDRNLPMWLVLD